MCTALPSLAEHNMSRIEIDRLESRVLFANQISFTDFSNTTDLVGNGFGGDPIVGGSRLRLTNSQNFTARSVWFDTAVPITAFRTDFSFRIRNQGGNEADGLTFTMQNGPTSALGGDGNDLGFGGITDSEAVTFNAFNLAAFGSRFGFASDGATPPIPDDMSPIDLHSGHIMHATVRYDGVTLSVFVSDSTNRSLMFTQAQTIDLPLAIGSNTAIVGFTAATGNFNSTQEIFSWSFSGGREPVITNNIGTPPTTDSKSRNLTVLADNPDTVEGDLTYTWTVDKKPAGAPDPIFSENGTNAAKNTTATFGRYGSYIIRVTATNPAGDSVAQRRTITIAQTGTSIRVTPHAQTIAPGGPLDYNAVLYDQFLDPMVDQSIIRFAVDSGGGSIDELTGAYTAPNSKGHAVIEASAGSISGTVGATIHD